MVSPTVAKQKDSVCSVGARILSTFLAAQEVSLPPYHRFVCTKTTASPWNISSHFILRTNTKRGASPWNPRSYSTMYATVPIQLIFYVIAQQFKSRARFGRRVSSPLVGGSSPLCVWSVRTHPARLVLSYVSEVFVPGGGGDAQRSCAWRRRPPDGSCPLRF